MFLERWRNPRPSLTEAQRARLAAWRRIPRVRADAALTAQRFVVVDVETSGLDLRRDRLLAIGAVAVRDARIPLAEHFQAVLRQTVASSEANILVHGIGGTEQAEGIDPATALLDFLDFANASPLVAFHAPFDRGMLERALRLHLGVTLDRDWLDLAMLAPALAPARGPHPRSLDDWTRLLGITHIRRHHALGDALATAELLTVMLSRAQSAGLRSVEDLLEAARSEALQRLQRG